MGHYDIGKVPKVDTRVKIPEEEFADRVRKLRQRLEKSNVDIGIVYGTPHMPGDVLYLSGYDPQLENTIVLVSQEKLFLLGGPEGARYAEEMLRFGEIRVLSELQIPLEDYPLIRIWDLRDVGKELVSGRITRAAILTRDDVMTTGVMSLMQKVLGKEVEFVDASDILYDMRFIKSVNEQAVLRVSNRICIEAVRAMVEVTEPGMRELEITAYGDYVMKNMGAYGYGFDSFILSGERINTCIGRGTNKVVRAGEMVRIAASARYEGYASTAARTVVAGGASREQAEFIEHVIKAHELAADKFICGGLEREVETAAWDYLKKHSLGQYQVYSVAHGTGITECLEARPITKHSEGRIPKNIAMMIDIGLYGHPKFYGAAIEDPYLINDRGETERLVDYPLRVYAVR